jgi:hypothetical protein
VEEGVERAGIDQSDMGECAYDYTSFQLPSINPNFSTPRDRLRAEVLREAK